MSRQKKQQINSESIPEHSSGGKRKEKSKPSAPHLGKGDTTLNHIQLVLELSGTQSSTPECRAAHSNQILIDKSQRSPLCTQTPKSSAKSGEGLISSERNCKPYWNESCKKLSALLLSHTKIDLPDSVLTTFNGYANNTGVKSWFSMRQTCLLKPRWLRISLPSSTVSAPDSTDSENTKLKSKKIRVYPSQELNKLWKQWNAACRYVYNQAIALQKASKKRWSKLSLRNAVMQSALPEWVKETPCHIRQNAIFDAHQAYSASPDCKFRSCRAPKQTLKFNDSNFSKGTWYPKLTKGLTFRASEPIPKTCERASMLIKEKDRWFAVFPEPVLGAATQSISVIALDPGVRTFLTGFDGSKFLEFGRGDMGRITRLCQHLDKLMGRAAKCNNRRQRQKMYKAAARMRTKIQNLVNEAHKQVACYLTQNYRVIFLPTFETSQMVAKAKRKINSKTARSMLTWAHYRFKTFLKQAAQTRDCIVVDVTEEYTSKTCTACGHIHLKLGGAKKFRCPECEHELDRDFNGAFGILLKALQDTAFTISPDGVAIVALPDNVSSCVA